MNSDPFTKPNTEDLPQVGEGDILDDPVKDTDRPLPLRSLLTRPVIISVANFSMLGLIDMGAVALIPLVWSTSVELGGLNMSPASIGLWMTGCGFMNCVFQIFAVPRIVGRFGPRRVFITSVLCFVPVYIMFPFENLASRHSHLGPNPATTLLIMLQLLALSISDMGFGKLSRTLRCQRSLKSCHPIRRDMYVHILCSPKQAVAWSYEWNRADDVLDSTHGRTSCCHIDICILTGKQYFGRKLCVCRATCHCMCWAGPRCAASEDHVET